MTALTATDFSAVLTYFQSDMSDYIANIPVEDCWAYADGESQWTCYCPNCLKWQQKRLAGEQDEDDSLDLEGDLQYETPFDNSRETLPICVDQRINLFELPYVEAKPNDLLAIIDTDENFVNHLTDSHDQVVTINTLLQSYMHDHPDAYWAGTVEGTKGRNCHVILQFNDLAIKPSNNSFILDLKKVIRTECIDQYYRFDQCDPEPISKNRNKTLNIRYNFAWKTLNQPERRLMFSYVDLLGEDPTNFNWDEATMTYYKTRTANLKKSNHGFNVLKALPMARYVCSSCNVPYSAAFPGCKPKDSCPNQFCEQYSPFPKYGQHHKSGDLPVLAGFIRQLMTIDLVIREKPLKKKTLISERLLSQNRLRGLPDYFGTALHLDSD